MWTPLRASSVADPGTESEGRIVGDSLSTEIGAETAGGVHEDRHLGLGIGLGESGKSGTVEHRRGFGGSSAALAGARRNIRRRPVKAAPRRRRRAPAKRGRKKAAPRRRRRPRAPARRRKPAKTRRRRRRPSSVAALQGSIF